MRMNGFFKTMGPFVALAALGALAGCGDRNFGFNWGGEEGVKLAELNLAGTAPDEIVMFGPDAVQVTSGEPFAVTVDGDETAAEHVRFKLEDGTLGIMRDHGNWSTNGVATIHVTVPSARRLILAGSGTMTSDKLSGNAHVSIAGSGHLATPSVAATSLKVEIAGSGTYDGAGTADSLDLSLAGSGMGSMAGLKVGSAKVNIAGSGEAVFASDGDVDARIMGSGTVTVRGSARCKVNSVGSGGLVCEREPEHAG